MHFYYFLCSLSQSVQVTLPKIPLTGQLLENRNLFPTVLKAGKSKIKAWTDWWEPFPGSQTVVFLLCFHTEEGEGSREPPEICSVRALIPVTRAPPSRPKHPPKTPPPNTIILEIRVKHRNLGKHPYITLPFPWEDSIKHVHMNFGFGLCL